MGSNTFLSVLTSPVCGLVLTGEPFNPRPKRQTIRWCQASILVWPAGWVLALMTLLAAPTPCSRTGFHISNISLWVPAVSTQVVVGAVTPAHEVPAAAVADGVKPGSTMIKSPGAAASIALWIDAVAGT